VPNRIGTTLRFTLLALVVLATGIALALPSPDSESARGDERPTIVDDDGGRPLFTVPALAPGAQFLRCIQLTYRGNGDAQLRLGGSVGGDGLAKQLGLTVERGSGGGYGSCAGFRGTTVYDGTLADLPARPSLTHQARDGDRATYRFTVTAASDLQTAPLTASATFTWQATGTPSDGTDDAGGGDPSGAPAPAGPADPASTPPPGDTRTNPPTEMPDSGEDTEKRPRGEGTGTRGDRGKPNLGGDDAPGSSAPKKDGSGPSLPDRLRKALAALTTVAAEGAKRAAFPLLLLLLMAAFMIGQHRLDSRDPKLALAPVHAEPDLPFDDLHLAPITVART
jgi:hypothetical protein